MRSIEFVTYCYSTKQKALFLDCCFTKHFVGQLFWDKENQNGNDNAPILSHVVEQKLYSLHFKESFEVLKRSPKISIGNYHCTYLSDLKIFSITLCDLNWIHLTFNVFFAG